MRFIFLLFIALFLASCGNQKLRFVRTDRVKQQVVKLEDVSTLKKKQTETIDMETPDREEKIESSASESAHVSDQSEEESINNSEEVELETIHFPLMEEDSVKLTPEEVASIEDEAMHSEKQGRWSFILSLLTYAFLVLGIICFAILVSSALSSTSPMLIVSVLTILFATLSLGSLISSIILGIKSLRARYTTRKGKNLAIAGLILSGLIVLYWLVGLLLSLI
jgi:hypothetical protein